MKKNISIIFVCLVLVLSILACGVTINRGDNQGGGTVRGSGAVVEQDRTVSNISSVELSMPGTLHIEMGDSETLRIEAQENLMEYIQTDASGGELRIKTRPGTNLISTQPINYYLTVTKLDGIAVSSSGDVESGDLQSGTFSVKISSSGNVTLSSLAADKIGVQISSSGNLEISGGQVQQQIIDISSSGDYEARDLESVEAQVNLTSSGSATIRVSDRLRGSLSSSGNVNYIGDPQVDVRTSSSGEAVQIGD